MQTLTFLFAFLAVLALIGLAAWLVRQFAGNRLGANTSRARMPRLAVIDAAAVDGRRRLVLVRRDNIEHLLMIGGPTDIVVEPNIVRAMPARDQMAQRPGVGAPSHRRGSRRCRTPAGATAMARRADPFDLAEPQMPEPPPRPARPSFADEVAPPGGAADAERRERSARLAFTPEPLPGRPADGPSRARTAARADAVARHLARRADDAAPAASSEAPKGRRRFARRNGRRRRRRRTAAAACPRRPCPSADQNLAEMAQRLEAALRRPAGEPRTAAPPVAPEPPPAAPRPRSEPTAPPAAAAAAEERFENLEDEMASLLGRPKNPS